MNHFFSMGGYGWYVWGSYLTVSAFLAAQWLLAFRRLKSL